MASSAPAAGCAASESPISGKGGKAPSCAPSGQASRATKPSGCQDSLAHDHPCEGSIRNLRLHANGLAPREALHQVPWVHTGSYAGRRHACESINRGP